MKRKKKKLNLRKILIICILLLFTYSFIKHNFSNPKLTNKISNILTNSEYDTIAKFQIDTYDGIGQEAVKNKEGYFTTFTTEEKNRKTYKEYKQNGDTPWSNKEYWGNTMAENGCRNNNNGYNIKWLQQKLLS